MGRARSISPTYDEIVGCGHQRLAARSWLRWKKCLEEGVVEIAHERQVLRAVELPDGRARMPGVISHATDLAEHPELVAEPLQHYARAVGRERGAGGSHCGMGLRVGHPEIVWAKLRAAADGARPASERVWSARPGVSPAGAG